MILAIDLSSHAGWCAGVPGERPHVGVWELPSVSNAGAQGGAFSDVLADAITVHRPGLIVIEADVNLHKQNPDGTAYQQIGMLYLAEVVCYRREVKMLTASASDARMGTLKRARWSQKGEAKTAVMAWCAAEGMSFTNHNIADAYVLWRYACGAFKTPKMRRAA